MIPSWLWIVFTVAAAFFQTLRNAMQRELTVTLGTVGATHVRFLFGFPFALLS
ncbi:MAG: EamA/RhaT family transporter, partial [Xanthobacteraceae bacterium]